MLSSTGVIAGKYRIREAIGQGGFTTVYRARHLAMDRDVAIKLFDAAQSTPKAIGRFEREARLVSQLKHPNTITIYDFGREENGMLYLVMEYVDGRTFKDLVLHEGTVEARRAASLMIQVLQSLEEAHHLGILHRDLKPDNIIVSQNHRGEDIVTVLDFGIAKVVGKDLGAIDAELTGANTFVGTPRYAAPEQLRGDASSLTVDVYAAGMVLWELLVGQPAASHSEFMKCAEEVFQAAPWRMPTNVGVPDRLEEIVHKAVEKDAARRFQSCREMRAELEAFLSDATDPGEDVFDPNLVLEDGGWVPLDEARQSQEQSHRTRGLSRPALRTKKMPTPELDMDFMPPARHQESAGRSSEIERHEDLAEAGRGSTLSNVAPKHSGRSSSVLRLGAMVGGVAVLIGVGLLSWDREVVEVVTVTQGDDGEIVWATRDELRSASDVDSTVGNRALMLVVEAAGWKLLEHKDSEDLASYQEEALTYIKDDVTLDFSILTARSLTIARSLMQETKSPHQAVQFEHKVVRMRPRNRAGHGPALELKDHLERYRALR